MTETTLERVNTKEYIRQARDLMPVAEVKQWAMPKWFLDRLRRAIRDGRFVTEFAESPTTALTSNKLTRGWLDHWGSSRNVRKCIPADRVFVSEPYELCIGKLNRIQRFADLLGLYWMLCARSWHYPGSTFRIEFWPKGDG
jgi:hypothetical protein